MSVAPARAARRRALERHYYLDEQRYRQELTAIWRRSWLYVAPSCEIAAPGAFRRLELCGDPVVVVRGLDGTLGALHNVCRHRGSIVVTEQAGRAERLVCPYHHWTYGLNGEALSCPGLDERAGRDALGLVAIEVREVAGLVFLCLGEAPPIEEMAAELTEAARRQGLERARVAARRTYRVGANWKLVLENNRECLHCVANHPEYVRSNFDRYDTASARRAGLAEALARHGDALGDAGAFLAEGGLAAFPDESGRWWSANRSALRAAFLTESLDGRPVAPVMGEYAARDVGTLRLRSLPNFWCHASADHAVVTRLLPLGIDATEAEVTWLVDAEAEEGRDYDLDDLTAFWARTSEQDWLICERQQAGVSSSAYRPGPLSSEHEANVAHLLDWYLERLGEAPG